MTREEQSLNEFVRIVYRFLTSVDVIDDIYKRKRISEFDPTQTLYERRKRKKKKHSPHRERKKHKFICLINLFSNKTC
jgi:hypothetical protein